MLKLHDKLLEEFSRAVTEDNYYRIGNIFYYLKAKRLFIKIHYGDQTTSGRIIRVINDRIRIYIPDFKEKQERRSALTFEALNRYYFCEVLIINVEHEIIEIQYPEKLKYISRRLYPRIAFDDLFMRFTTLYSLIFQTKDEERELENSHPLFFKEIKEDNPSLRVLFQLIIDEVKTITEDFEIKTYGQNEILSFDKIIERLTVGEGRNVLIQNTMDLESYFQDYNSKMIESMSSHYQQVLEKNGKETAEKEIYDLQKADVSNFLLSYFALPIIIFDRPRGYFIMRTDSFDKRHISFAQAEDIARLFQVFSYAMTKVRIRMSHYNPINISTRIVNISMSGLLMEMQDATLFEYLKSNRRIKMLIPIMGEELEIYGEIIRFFSENNYFYMGVLFFKTRPGDMIKLEQYLYENRSYQFF